MERKHYRLSGPIWNLLYLAALSVCLSLAAWQIKAVIRREAAVKAQQAIVEARAKAQQDAARAQAIAERETAEAQAKANQEAEWAQAKAKPSLVGRQDPVTKAFFAAVRHGEVQAVLVALNAGAGVNAREEDPSANTDKERADPSSLPTALLLLYQFGLDSYRRPRENVALLRVLLDHGADPNAVNERGETPLILAAEAGYTASVTLLLEFRADVNHQDKSGETALMAAAEGGSFRMMPFLLAHHAKVDLTDEDGDTALDYARAYPKNDTRQAMERALGKTAITHKSVGVSWVFRIKEGGDGAPRGKVYLKVNGRLILIVPEAGGNYHDVGNGDYEGHNMPASALTACSSWWAGGGEEMYVIRKGNRLKIYRRFVEEGSDDVDAPAGSDQYRLIRSISIP